MPALRLIRSNTRSSAPGSLQRYLLTAMAAAVFIVITATGSYAQEDVYVDAPAEVAQPDAAGAAAARAPAGNYRDQFNWGLINYGFRKHVYSQYSGDRIFSEGNSPSSFINFGWIRIVPLDYTYLPGIGYGADFLGIFQTSEDVYSGDNDKVTGPSIDMSAYITNIKLRLYFMDPVEDFLHPFFGLSWGVVFGDFNTTKVGGAKTSTSFFGMTVFRNIGVEIKLGDRGGLVTEFRTVTANQVGTSNDPFNRGDGDRIDLDFSGITIALTGYYRF